MSSCPRWLLVVVMLGICTPATAQYNPFGPTVHVASGGQHTCAIDQAGQLYCWGFNAAGQLGIGSVESQANPFPVSLPSPGLTTSLGQNHSCAITEVGSTFCWGWNNSGQVGAGPGGDRLSPTSIPELGNNAINISAGERHTCAVLSTGRAKCWGRNTSGELGNDDPGLLTRNRPVDVVELYDAVKIAAGSAHTCALRANGQVVCWGSALVLGNGNANPSNRPSDPVLLPLAATEIVAGDKRSCALVSDGRVFCWGEGTALPAQIEGFDEVVDHIALGSEHGCAKTVSQEVHCWGLSHFGQAGYSPSGSSPEAMLVPISEPTVSLSAGKDTTCARSVSGALRCWGWNSWGQTGTGSAAISVNPRPAAVPLRPMSRIFASSAMFCAVASAGELWCSGANSHGQAGTGNYGIASPLSRVAGGFAGSIAATGSRHSCALSSNGAIFCWGGNTSGQLGTSGPGVALPQIVSAVAHSATDIDAAAFHTCAVATEQALCWGNNASGQLGRGDSAPPASAEPAPVIGLPPNVVQISTANTHSCAITASGGAFCWGGNADGKLGDGTLISRRTAVPVETLASDVRQISAGNVHTCAVKTDGSAWCWGNSLYGALGNGGTVRRLTPERVIAVDAPYSSISAGSYFTCASTEDGDVYCFGYNAQGQLGIGTNTSSPIPQRVPLAITAVQVDVGTDHACALDPQGKASCWGMGQFGQLANNALDWSQPQLVVVVDPVIFRSGFE